MERYTKLTENTYYGYSSGKFYFVTDKISKSTMISLLAEKFHEHPSWVRDRIGEGANTKTLAKIAENPNAKLLVLDKNTYEVVQIID